MKTPLITALVVCLFAAQVPAVMIYEQTPDPAGGVAPSSWAPPDGTDNDVWCYESFVLDATVPITEVHWRGGYQYVGYGLVTDFTITFYATNSTGSEPLCGLPGDNDTYLARFFIAGNAGQTPAGVYGGITMYDYHATLTQAFPATAGVKYWVQIEGEVSGSPFWGVAWGTGGNGNHFRYTGGSHMFQFWPHDLAFSLHTTAAPTYTVTTSASPAGTGITTGDGPYPAGTPATVTAVGNVGWGFVDWTESGVHVSSNASYTFTVNADRNLVANFQPAYTVTTSSAPFIGGTTTGDGLYIGGTIVTVTATTNPRWEFVNWTEYGSPVSSSPSYTFTAAANRNLVAHYAVAPGVVLFDFDDETLYAPLPLDITRGGLTAHVWAPGTFGYYIQYADFTGFLPTGFAGKCVYPSSLYQATLEVDFSAPITEFSIMFAPQEYNCNDTSTIRATAYLGGVLVGTSTANADNPGTWPSGTLDFASPGTFDQMVITYDADPPTCQDFIRAFMADNVLVTVAGGTTAVGDGEPAVALAPIVAPNPFDGETVVRFGVARSGPVSVSVYDLRGRLVRTLVDGAGLERGDRSVRWNGRDERGQRAASGVYVCRIQADGRTQSTRMMLLRRR